MHLYLGAASTALGTALIALGGHAARAQIITLPEIINTADQRPLESSRVGAAVTVISGDKLREQEIPTVVDALRQVPGIAIAQTGGRGGLTTVMMRGSDARHVMVQIDGVEVNQTGFPGFDFADLPVESIDRIEVIRGPQSGIYGSNAQAGVISIITRSGRGMKGWAADAKLEGGSRTTGSGAATVRGATGPFYASMSFTDYSTAGYNVSRFGSEPDGSRALVYTAKGGVNFNEYFNVEGVVYHTNRYVQTDPQDFRFGSPMAGFAIDGDEATRYKSTAGRVGATLTLWDGHWIQSADIKTFDEHTRNFLDRVLTFGADGTRMTVDYKSTLLFNTAILGGETHSVTGLVENRREDYRQLFSFTDYLKNRTSVAGEYVLGLPTLTTLSSAVREDINSAFPDVLTWRFALSQPLPGTGMRIHSSAGKGVTDPDVFQLFGSEFNLPNPTLTPEQSVGWDVGVEQTLWDGRVVNDVTFFSTDFTNKIELTFDDALANFIYRNGIGKAHRQGVEISSTFNILEWLSTTATYTFTGAKTSAGDPEVRRPPHSASFEATARFLDNRAKFTAAVVYNSVRKDFFFSDAGTTLVDLPAATVVRAILSYDVTPGITAYVRGENIFDNKYEEVFSYRAPGAGVYTGVRGKFGS